jgi:SWI/SNF-related matrix-associated actin-dependent regulator 1 of chromatin subfamily A
MGKTPRPFQQTGAKFLASNWHAFLADEPGLGKSCQAIMAAEMVNARHVLVTCPASVRLGWYQEIEEWRGRTEGWEVISYDGARKFCRRPTRDKYDAFIPDEIHFCKECDSQRTQAVLGDEFGLIRRADYKWPLSGTPILNRPRELYPILKTLAGERLAPYTTFPRFAQRFCGAYFDGRGVNTKGASNLEDLAARLKGFMLRRTKAQVLPELPKKIITRVPLEVSASDMAPVREVEETISNREAYVSPIMEDYSQLGDLARLRRATGLAKVHAITAFVDELLDTVEKVVVFAWHRDVIAALTANFSSVGRGVAIHMGGMGDIRKKESVDRFKDDPGCRVFIGQMQASGTGMNGLQHAANDCVLGEIDWTPGMMSQAIDRLDRLDKKFSGPVNAYVPFIPKSLESAMLGCNDSKSLVIDHLLHTDTPSGGISNLFGILGDLI